MYFIINFWIYTLLILPVFAFSQVAEISCQDNSCGSPGSIQVYSQDSIVIYPEVSVSVMSNDTLYFDHLTGGEYIITVFSNSLDSISYHVTLRDTGFPEAGCFVEPGTRDNELIFSDTAVGNHTWLLYEDNMFLELSREQSCSFFFADTAGHDYYVVHIISNINGCMDTCSINNVQAMIPLSYSSDFTIENGILCINCYKGPFSIYHINGKLVYTKNVDIALSLNLDFLKKGIYIFKFSDHTEKVLIP